MSHAPLPSSARLLVLFIGLTLADLAQSVQAPTMAGACRLLAIYVGEPSTDLADIAPPDRVYFWGEGFHGNRVYRVFPKKDSAPTRILKVYASQRLLENDLLAFRAIENSGRVGESGEFDVIASRATSRKLTLELGDAQGENLLELLYDSEIPPSLKTKWLKEYDRSVVALKAGLEKTLGDRVTKSVLVDKKDDFGEWRVLVLEFKSDERGGSVTIIIKPDNVIVPAGGRGNSRLRLVDPY